MRWLVVAGVMAVVLTGAMAPAHASFGVESDHTTLIAQTAPSSDAKREILALDLAPSTSTHDASRPSSMTTATPPPSMLLLVGTGLTGLAGMVRRHLARRHRIAW